MYKRILLFVLVLLAPLARGAVGTTPGGGGGSSSGPTNGITGTQATNIVNGLVPPMLITTSNALTTGDQTVNPSLENWARYLNRGSNATMLALGDSTGLYTLNYLRQPIEHYLGSNGVLAGSFSPIELAGAYTNLGSASSTNWPGTFYILGTNSTGGPGALATTNYGSANNGAIWSDTFRAYVGKSPSAGTLMWQTQTNGGAWTTRAILDATGDYGIIATQLVVSPVGWYRSRLIYSNSGPTHVYGLEQLDGTATGRGARFFDLTMAGSTLSQLTNIATNVLGPALQLLNPAVVWLENRDNAAIYSNSLPALRSLLTNWVRGADVVLVGVGPQTSSDSDLVAQNAQARTFATTNKWTYLDMRALPNYVSYFTVTNFYGVGDGGGIHYPDAAQRAQATWAMKRLPLLDNAFITGLYVGGAPAMSPPEGGRYFEPRKTTNNLSGNLGINGFATVGSYLEASGSFLFGGASSGLVLANRSSPTDAGSRWTLYNSGGTLIHYYGGDIFEQSATAGNYRFSPTTSGSAASRLGDTNKAWSQLHASNVIAYAKVGIGTNAPTAALEVQGNIAASGSVLNGSGYGLEADSDGNFRDIQISNGRVIYLRSGGDDARLTSPNTGLLQIGASAVKVGLNTNAPAATFHIQSARSNQVFAISGVTNVTPAAPSTVVAWIPITLNGTNGFIPFYQ